MKKAIKTIFIITVLLVFLIIILLIWSFFGIRYHIKTEYGDSFTIIRSIWTEDIILNDDNSKYSTSLLSFNRKNDFLSICDSPCFRCYQVKNEEVNKYICKIKSHDSNLFFTINVHDFEGTMLNIQEMKNWYFSDLMCDSQYIKILLPFLDKLYHDEMIEIAQKLTSGDYEGLDKYGLTEEMINDKESLDEKVKIMEEYLKENTD